MIPSIVRIDLLYGALHSLNVQRNMEKTRVLINTFSTLPLDDAAAEHAAEIKHHLASLGTPIGANDLLIAAVARANRRTLVSHNTSEFSRVPALRVEDWQKA